MFGTISRLGATSCALFNEREQIKNQKNPCILKSWEPIIVNRTIKMFLTISLKFMVMLEGLTQLKLWFSKHWTAWETIPGWVCVTLPKTSKHHRWSTGGVSSKLSCHNKIYSITLSTHFFRFALYLLFEWLVMTYLITKLSPFDVS